METISVKQPINLKVVKFELDFTQFFEEKPKPIKKRKEIRIPKIKTRKRSIVPPPPSVNVSNPKRDVKDLVEELLEELYSDRRDWSHNSTSNFCRGSTTAASLASSQSIYRERTDSIEISYLETLDINSLKNERAEWENRLRISGERLAKYVRVRDRLRRQQKKLCTAFTVLLQHITGDANVRFGLTPGEGEGPGEGGYAEWLHAMRLVARLPAGVPHHFRRKLWLTLAERHLTARAIDWPVAERACFRGTAQPDDTELGAQILKDLHRTGCSLFCGTEGRENQAMLRRVLLAYARWNKDVGYCQGFNMLAAIILEVMEKSESDSLKVMIYLVEAVLPEGYFADDLRGLSADMAAFRDLLRLRLPRLANHMDHLQRISDAIGLYESFKGKKGLNSVPSLLVGWFVHDETLTRLQMWREQTSSYHCLPIWLGTDFEPISGGVEPPLPDVFTMQWFLTLYATWIPRESLLKIWDLVLLDGNEILLLTALAIWDMLQDRILSTRSADEFYSCMGSGVGVVFQAGEALVARVVALGSEPELPRLRSKHRYRVAPPAPPAAVYQPPLHSAVQSMTKRGLRLFYSEDEGDSSDDGNKMALATVIPRREERMGAGDRLSLDIGALKRQYARLRERQRQAHVILAAACARHHAAVGVSTSPTSLTVNNLLLGKSAIVSSRGRRLGPPPGAIPPSRQTSSTHEKTDSRQRGCTDETISWNEERYKKNLDRKNSLKWKDIKKDKVLGRKASIDLDETGDGIIVSEHEANEMIASLRSRSSSETSSYSSHTVASSTDTSLCDDNERASDSEPDLPLDVDNNKLAPSKKKIVVTSPLLKETIIKPPAIEEARILHSPIEDRVFHSVKSIQDISEYLDSAAGEPLRTYIDGFETKLKDSVINISSESDNYKRKSPFKSISPFVAEIKPESNEVFQRLSRPEYQVTSRSSESIKSKNSSKLTTNFTELSPLDISPRHFGITRKSPCEYYHKPIIKSKCPSSSQSSTRPPDIIDSLTMYPNFVPDIDLSEKNISDFESPLRSPDAESVVISEDEPPILLKIDKYFEHSPEFFGARVTDPNNTDIPNRRATKRQSRIPKKPDSLTLKINNNEKLLNIEAERASSLPQSHSFTEIKYFSSDNDNSEEEEEEASKSIQFGTEETEKIGHNIWEKTETVECKASEITSSSAEQKFSPKNSFLDYGRKNSERALQIIQENSQILNRILTKQNVTDNNATAKVVPELNKSGNQINLSSSMPPEKSIRGIKSIDSPLMKESTSDSRIGLRKKSFNNGTEKNDYIRVRPISIDDPFSLEVRNFIARNEELTLKNVKSPSSECLGNKTDLYGWENKGFFAKCEYKTPKVNNDFTLNSNKKSESVQTADTSHKALTTKTTCDWSQSFLIDSKTSVALLPTEIKDTSSYECKYISDDYKYPLSNRYNDFVLSKVSDICSKPVGQGPKVIENPSKVEDHTSDFTHAVTSSISFTYEHSLEEDSPIGAKSNSSDTLCQIASLDQISTPISPKTFPNRETPTLPKDADKTDPMVAKLESDDTCSAITSLLETDTLSSLSYPRSPSTGSYHHFPTRPAMRMPKELAVRLGMYPKDTISSPPK